MRKIIIAFIITIFMIAPSENVKGQWQSIITEAHFPTVNVLTEINTKLSFGIGRVELFGQFGLYFQTFEDKVTIETWNFEGLHQRLELHTQRFAPMEIINAGIKFRITDKDRIILGYKISDNILRLSGNLLLRQSYLGYIRRENLSQRMNVELSLLLNPGWSFLGNLSSSIRSLGGYGRGGFAAFGAGLNYELVRNLNLNLRLKYTRWYNVRHPQWLEVVTTERHFTYNFINFSIGIHYHIPLFGGQQQAPQRPPRQRVAPHQRALPCPPGQMRHNRSWDRPSSVFNHPTAR